MDDSSSFWYFIEIQGNCDNIYHLGYLYTFTEQLLIALEQLPGDERTMLGFIGVDSAVHFFQFRGKSRPQQLIVEEYGGNEVFKKNLLQIY